MKVVLGFLTALMSLTAFAYGCEKSNRVEKMYVTQDAVCIKDKGIFVRLADGTEFQVKNLRSDQKGIFVLKNDIHSLKKEYLRYYCKDCNLSFEEEIDFYRHVLYVHRYVSSRRDKREKRALSCMSCSPHLTPIIQHSER